MQRFNITSGLTWESRVGYSRLVKVGRQIYVTGTTAMLPSGEFVGDGDVYAQANQALRSIEAALEQVDSNLSDVVRTRMYVTNIARDWKAVGKAHSELMGEFMPATTMVEVSALVDPRMLVEIEADAIKGAGQVVAGVRPRIVEASLESESDLADMLRSVDLPVPEAGDQVRMLKAYVGGELVGCVGCERYGSSALLRSLVVIRRAKGEGVGRALVEALLGRLKEDGVKQVFLVTADTAQYFGYMGFLPVPVSQVDDEVRRSPEFNAYEPDSATYMRYRIVSPA